MREILFRGQTNNGKWEYGSLLSPNQFNEIPHIVYIDYLNEYGEIGEIATPVIPSTVGQYTGLKDKNGVRIFEGDIIRFKDNIGYVIYTDDDASFLVDSPNRYIAMDYSSEFEVIGNIHDNPELLKGGEKQCLKSN